MKKIILFLLIGIMMVSIASSQLQNINSNTYDIIKDLQAKTPNDNEKIILEKYYSNKEKGMINIKEYVKGQDQVIISFNKTNWRVITPKKKFNDVMAEAKAKEIIKLGDV